MKNYNSDNDASQTPTLLMYLIVFPVGGLKPLSLSIEAL